MTPFPEKLEGKDDPPKSKRKKEITDKTKKKTFDLKKDCFGVIESQYGEDEYCDAVLKDGAGFKICVMPRQHCESLINYADWFKDNYGVKIDFVTTNADAHPAPNVELNDTYAKKRIEILKSLQSELVKMPPQLFKKLGIKRFMICGRIKIHGQEKSGAVAGDTFYIVETYSFWHEMMHVVDKQQGGAFSGRNWDPSFKEADAKAQKKNFEWGMLDPKTFDECKTKSKLFKSCFYDEEQSDYAAYLLNLEKGNAWFSKHLPNHVNAKNPLNSAKIAAMKEILLRWSKGVLDEHYWESLKEGKVDESYWNKRLNNRFEKK